MSDIYAVLSCPAPFQLFYTWGQQAAAAAADGRQASSGGTAPGPEPAGEEAGQEAAGEMEPELEEGTQPAP